MTTHVYNEFIGKTISSIDKYGNDILEFNFTDGKTARMYNQQDCCGCVYIEDICGDLDYLIGHPLVEAEEEVETEEVEEEVSGALAPIDAEYVKDGIASYTWTFYRLSTIKGSVVIRWYGTSNGYYSDRVTFEYV